MKNILSIVALTLLLCNNKTFAQNNIFLSQGRIEFERKVNLWAQADDVDDQEWKDFIKKIVPQFELTYFDLEFNGNKTLYKPGRENAENNKIWDHPPAEDNVVFTNLLTQQAASQKNVYEEKFLVQDSVRQITWKITNETRNIAGFECRRANAIIMDSIYIVAYYTDAITTTGGPESFTGLPGMILGLAIPHEHETWFATKVYTEPINEATLVAPVKGKKSTNASMIASLQDIMKNWGKWTQRYIRQIAI